MQWFKNLNTATKLLTAFGFMAAILGVVGWWGLMGMSSMESMLQSLYEREMTGLSAIKEANCNLIGAGRALRAVFMAKDHAELDKHTAIYQKSVSKLSENLERAAKTIITSEGKMRTDRVRAALPSYSSRADEFVELMANGKQAEARFALEKVRTVADEVEKDMVWLAEAKDKLGAQAYQEGNESYRQARVVMISVIVVAIAIAWLLGFFIARLISKPLGNAVEVLEAVAGGDLTQKLVVNTTDEVGRMAEALNEAVVSMRRAMVDVRSSSDTVASASQELAAASEELSSGAQEQASSQEETSATLEELTTTVRQNAENARKATQVAVDASHAAEKGGTVVGHAVSAMGEINASSKRIADIITTIDEIAFQTNLLALNAAVEAARAGEQGRGFAVVAAEVRNLAQRSATAAKEIKALIQDSVKKVENGSELVNDSGRTLNDIVQSVKRVTDIVAEIAAASEEQATGIEQVGKAMTQMDQVTQQNSAQTEELSSTAQSLSTSAEQLQALVGRFTLIGERQTNASGNTAKKATAPGKTSPHKTKPARSLAPVSVRNGQESRHSLTNLSKAAQEPWTAVEHFEEY